MKLKITLLVITFFTVNACKTLAPGSDEFSLEKRNYVGSELKIDGYFYDGWTVELFYRNGVHLYGYSGYNEEDLIDMENKFINGDFYNNCKDSETSWGIFIIENDSIKFERYNPPSGPGYLHAYVREGPIINDTTFRIVRIYRYEDGEIEKIETDRLYHFKKFSPKPDSTNSFID